MHLPALLLVFGDARLDADQKALHEPRAQFVPLLRAAAVRLDLHAPVRRVIISSLL